MGTTHGKKKIQYMALKIDHEYLNKAIVICMDGQYYIKTCLSIERQEFLKWIQKIQPLQKVNLSRLFLPIKYTHEITGVCGTDGQAEILYPNYPYLLSIELQDRIGIKKIFSEFQLWYILYTIIKAKNQLGVNQIIGDIRPQNIMVNDEGFIKVLCNHSWPYIKTRSQKLLNWKNIFVSPEEISVLRMGKFYQNQIQQSTQIFSAGLTILSLGNLDNKTIFYNHQRKLFIQQNYNIFREQWIRNKNYSIILKAVVLSLIELDVVKRITQIQLWNFLSKYEQQIAKQIIFVIQNPPIKIKKYINIIEQYQYTRAEQIIELPFKSREKQDNFQMYNKE